MTCLTTGGYYDAGQVCFDLDDGLGGDTHECRCPLGAEKEYYTHENIAVYDAEDGAVDGVIEFTQELWEKGWFDAVAATASGTNPVLNGLGLAAPDKVIGIQFSNQEGNGNLGDTFPARFNQVEMAFFLVRWNEVTEQWISEIPWQCVDKPQCENLICPGRYRPDIGCKENPFFAMSNMVTDANISAYTPLATYPSGFYKTEDFLAGTPLTTAELASATDAIALQSPQSDRDDSHTTALTGETDAGTSLSGQFTFWDKTGDQLLSPSSDCFCPPGETFDGNAECAVGVTIRTAERQSRRLLARAGLSSCTACPLEDNPSVQEATYRELLQAEIDCETLAITSGTEHYLDVTYPSDCCPDVNCVAGKVSKSSDSLRLYRIV